MNGKGHKAGLLGRIFGRDQDRAGVPAGAGRGQEGDPAGSEGPASAAAHDDASPAGAASTGAAAAVDGGAGEKERSGWFSRLKAGLAKSSNRLSENIAGVFTKRKLDAASLEELEEVLIRADLGLETATRVTEALAQERFDKDISPEGVRAVLASEIEKVLAPVARPLHLAAGVKPHIILLVGVNGTGKTTTIGKLAARFAREGKAVMLVAGDTFRAAAIDQLAIWGERTGAQVVARGVGADPAGLAFDAVERARSEGCDVVLIDTAGRLQNRQALMSELEKITRVLKKVDNAAPHDVVLVLDATTGQNALDQVEVFRKRAGVTGLVMTKLDGSAKGGILVAIAAKFGLPVFAVGVGEGVDDLQPFEAGEFARAITLG